MYGRRFLGLKSRGIFRPKPITRHGTGKIEKKARRALYAGIGLAVTILGSIGILYCGLYPQLIKDLLPTIIEVAIIPLLIVAFYLIGLLEADEAIYENDAKEVKDGDTGTKDT